MDTVSIVEDYVGFEKSVSNTIGLIEGPIFTTNAEGLFEIYLNNLPSNQQHYNCNSCKRFIEKFGGLVTVGDNGSTNSAVFGSALASDFFLASILEINRVVRKAKITGVFYSEEKVWGTPVTKEWTHLHGTPLAVYKNLIKTAFQAMAEKKEDYIAIKRAMAEISTSAIVTAIRLLESEAMYRSEKVLGVAQWFSKLYENRNDNLIWKAVATAPPGFCHIRSTMIGTLLSDIEEGLSTDVIMAKFKEKMHPLEYQRPKVVSDGTIAQAEKIVEKLQTAGALERKFAELEDMKVRIWEPKVVPEAPKTGGVFDKLKEGAKKSELILPPTTMTWVKFKETVLPKALSMEVVVPYHSTSFFGMVTAANPDAPNILQWNNPISWYFCHDPKSAEYWNLRGGSLVKVKAICPCPAHWEFMTSHFPEMAMFILEGCQVVTDKFGGGLFPEILKADYHSIRSVMEAHAKTASVAGRGSANGIALQKGVSKDNQLVVIVKDGMSAAQYRIDRWD